MTNREEEPLLGQTPPAEVQSNGPSTPRIDGDGSSPSLPYKKIIVLVGLLIILLDFADMLRTTPKIRLFEISICRRYYLAHDKSRINPDGNVDEALCKVDEIQQSLALVRGWLGLFQGIPALLLAIPYGILADAKGRRLVMGLFLIGDVMAEIWILCVCYFNDIFPVQAVWASAAFQLIGGGSAVVSAVTLAMVADVAPESERLRAFFLMGAAQLINEIIAPVLSSLLMAQGYLYVPMFIALPMELAGFGILFVIPNTLARKSHSASGQVPEQTDNSTPADSVDEIPKKDSSGLTRRMSILSKPAKRLALLVVSDVRIGLVLLAFMVNKLSRQITELLVQYSSKRLGWTLAKATYLLSIRAAVTVVIYLAALPAVISLLHRWARLNASETDIWIAKASVFLLTAGALMMGISDNATSLIISLIIFTLGSGFRQSIQSFITSLIDQNQIGSLYTIISIIDVIGSMAASALLAGTFAKGIQLGGMALGLPFLVSAGLYAISGLGVWCIKSQR